MKHFYQYVTIGRAWIEQYFGELFHHGVKNQRWGVKNGPPYPIDRTALSKYKVKDMNTGIEYSFSTGATLQNKETFAGKGTKKKLRKAVIEGLTEQYGGTPDGWKHCKANSMIDFDGEDRPAEVHWFEQDRLGKFNFKIKKWKDE